MRNETNFQNLILNKHLKALSLVLLSYDMLPAAFYVVANGWRGMINAVPFVVILFICGIGSPMFREFISRVELG